MNKGQNNHKVDIFPILVIALGLLAQLLSSRTSNRHKMRCWCLGMEMVGEDRWLRCLKMLVDIIFFFPYRLDDNINYVSSTSSAAFAR